MDRPRRIAPKLPAATFKGHGQRLTFNEGVADSINQKKLDAARNAFHLSQRPPLKVPKRSIMVTGKQCDSTHKLRLHVRECRGTYTTRAL